MRLTPSRLLARRPRVAPHGYRALGRLAALLVLALSGCLDSGPDPYAEAARDADRKADDVTPAIIELRDRLLFPTSAGHEFIDFYYRYALFAARSIEAVELPGEPKRDGLGWLRDFLGLGFLVLSWAALIAPLLALVAALFVAATAAALLHRLGCTTRRAWALALSGGAVFCLLLVLSPGVRSWRQDRERVGELRQAAGRDGPSVFAAALSDADPALRFEAAVGLAGSATAAELLPCQNGLRDPDPRVRMWCARALGRVGHRGSVPLLLPLLDDPEPLVRCYAAYGLSGIGDPTALPALRDLLRRNEHVYVSKYAAEAIWTIERR